MHSLVSINEALSSIEARNGLSGLQLSPLGVCSFEYQGTIVQLEYLASAGTLQIYAPLVSVDAVVDEQGERDFFRMLLSLNLTHPDLLGTNFAIHPGDDLVILQDRLSADHCAADTLEERLTTFLWLVEIWTRRLLQFQNLEELKETVRQADADELEEYLLGDRDAISEQPSGSVLLPLMQNRFV